MQTDMAVPSDKTLFVDETLSAVPEALGKLIDNSPSCIYLVDVDLRFLHASEGARAFYGQESAVIGKPLYEVLRTVWPEPFAREIVDRFRKTLETGEHYLASRETAWRKDVPTVVVRDWRIDRVSLADGRYGAVCQFRDISHERKLESALRDTEERLATQLTAVFRLNELSKITIPVGKIETLYEYMLDAATALMHSDFASLQLLERDDADNEVALRLLAHRGFHAESALHWQQVYAGTWSTCGVAFRIRKRFAIPDIEQWDAIKSTDDYAAYRRSGIRAVQTTPLLSRTGRLLGMLSTHWKEPYSPSDGELRAFDILARQVADFLEASRNE